MSTDSAPEKEFGIRLKGQTARMLRDLMKAENRTGIGQVTHLIAKAHGHLRVSQGEFGGQASGR